jgi:LemA protein
VSNYNTAIQKFPNVVFAGMFGFSEREFFEAEDAARVVPEVKF